MEAGSAVRCRISFLLMLAAVVLLMPAASAHATFPGLNGKITFSSNASGNHEIYTVNPDGSGLTNLTNSPSDEENYPAWSADGKRIVFTKDVSMGSSFDGYCGYLWTMNADGSGKTQILPATYQTTYAHEAAWSPDGQQIAAGDCGQEVYTINSDGTGHSGIPPGFDYGDPAGIDWSPDGQRIAFAVYDHGKGTYFLATNKPDGSDYRDISTDPFHGLFTGEPSWSPDSQMIAYFRFDYSGAPSGIVTANPDGTSPTLIKNVGDGTYRGVAWSPDKTKIGYILNSTMYIMNADGTGAAAVPGVTIPNSSGSHSGWLDWQPLKPPGYARPKSATPETIRLVPSQVPCASANSTHGAPLAVPSCNPPQQTSGYATVGTQDANNNAAKSTGLLQAKAVGESPIDLNNGDQTDIDFTVTITDVRNKQTPALDYSGELRAAFNLRLTDRLSGPGLIHPATSTDTTFAFTIPCSVTVDPSIGATCSTSTSADAVMPGITPEFTRAVWELGQVKVYDGGSDGDGDTTADNNLFVTQGLFAP